MKKSIAMILLLVLALIMTGCGSQPKPDSTVENFFKAAKVLDLESMAENVDPATKMELPQMDEILQTGEVSEDTLPASEYFIDYLKTNASKLDYTIKNTEVNEDKATVTVDVSYVNTLPIFKETIGEVFMQAFSMLFSGVEMTEEETNQLFEKVLKEKIESSTESLANKTITLPLILKEKTWYISELNDDLLNAVSLGLNDADSIFEDSGEAEMDDDSDPVYALYDIDNYIIGDLWNDGFIDISYFLETGKGSMDQELDVELTIQQLGKSMEKKPEYDEFINGLDDEYSAIKEVWNKLSAEADKLYDQIDSGASTISVDLFRQYMDAFSEMVYEIE
ncbi:DUF4878 domain-containing protein [Alkalibacter mobilis]|uniref:DUF4878 domain-containing protein n=1 Tax=Alkalibacter mobilis TaxID=2787712 RepID=UPI00189F1602|nr:DUF4878 domain-containing protein [Alkalibacter mobilis]MBF7096660.1 DUF4878 domain-containing protein [Alkalibacter mobilis]